MNSPSLWSEYDLTCSRATNMAEAIERITAEHRCASSFQSQLPTLCDPPSQATHSNMLTHHRIVVSQPKMETWQNSLKKLPAHLKVHVHNGCDRVARES
jgi:hypothetical protein